MRVVTCSTIPEPCGGGEGCCATTVAVSKTASKPVCATNRFIERSFTLLRLLLRKMRLRPEFLVHKHGLFCVVGAPFAPVCNTELIIGVIGRAQVDRGFQVLNGVLHL